MRDLKLPVGENSDIIKISIGELKEICKQVRDITLEESSKIIENHTRYNCDDHTPYRGACVSCGRTDNFEIISGDPDDIKEEILSLKDSEELKIE